MQCSGAGCAMIKEGCLNAWGSLSCIWWTQIRLSGPSLIGKYIYFSSIQAFSTVSPKLFFLLCKISIYVKKKKKFTKNLHKILWSTVQKYVQSHGNQFHFFLTQILNYYIEHKSVNSWSFIHVRPKAAAESASVVTSRLWSRLKVTVYGLKQSESAPNERFGIWAGNEPQAASWFFFRWHWNIYFLI